MRLCVVDLETNYSFVQKLRGGAKREVSDYGDCFNPDNRVILVGVMDYVSGQYVSYDMRLPGRLAMLRRCLAKYDAIIGHNVKYEYLWLRRIGLDLSTKKFYDTMLLEYINLQGEHKTNGLSLDVVAPRYGGVKKIDIVKRFWEAGMNTSDVPAGILSHYLYLDVDNTRKVFAGLVQKKGVVDQREFCAFYAELLHCVAQMEYNGAKFNDESLAEVSDSIEESLITAANNLSEICVDLMKKRDTADFKPLNLDSPAQMMPLLYSLELIKEKKDVWKQFATTFRPRRKGAPAKLETMVDECFTRLEWGAGIKVSTAWLDDHKLIGTSGFSTGSKAIDALSEWSGLTKKQEKLIRALEAYSKASTWKSSNLAGVLNGVKHDGYIHGNFNMAVTATRRFSSSNPNMQNWPREGTNPLKMLIRSRFANGFIVNTDYKQLEFRVAGLLSGDDVLMKDVANGFDIHDHSARMAFGDKYINASDKDKYELRTKAKRTTFKFQYGAMPKNATEQAIYDAFYGKYRKLAQWQEKIEYYIIRDKKYTCPFTGSTFAFPEARADNKALWITKAKNYPVQYLASVITNCAIIGITEGLRELGEKGLLILSVHDSNVMDVSIESFEQGMSIIKDRMENINPVFERFFKKRLDILLGCDITYGANWYQQEKYIDRNTTKAVA